MKELETDFQDLDELEEDETAMDDENGEEDLELGGRRIFTDKSDPPINALHTLYKDGDLVLDPIFQRRKVWDDTGRFAQDQPAFWDTKLWFCNFYWKEVYALRSFQGDY